SVAENDRQRRARGQEDRAGLYEPAGRGQQSDQRAAGDCADNESAESDERRAPVPRACAPGAGPAARVHHERHGCPPPLLPPAPVRRAAQPSAAAAVASLCAITRPRGAAGGFAILLAGNDDRGSSVSSERRILLTGFEPWADHALNPAQRLAERLDGWRAGNVRAVGLVLPVAARPANATVAAALRDLRPSAVGHLGPAAGPPAPTLRPR